MGPTLPPTQPIPSGQQPPLRTPHEGWHTPVTGSISQCGAGPHSQTPASQVAAPGQVPVWQVRPHAVT